MIEITARILIEEGAEPTALEAAVLAALGGQQTSVLVTDAKEEEEEEAPAPAPARKTRAPRAKPAAEVPMALEVPAEVPGDPVADETSTSDDTEPDEDLLGGGEDEADATATLEDAVEAATAAVAQKQTSKVKAALQKVGATKVSQLKGKAIQEFVDAMKED